jgi:hypothetical protein
MEMGLFGHSNRMKLVERHWIGALMNAILQRRRDQ